MKNKVAGISFQEENVLLLARENDDYSLPKKALLDEYYDGDRVYKFDFYLANKAKLVPEPDNPHDPKAVAVYAQHPLSLEWLKIGYIKAGSTGRVDTSASYNLEMGGGPYKEISEDEVESGEVNFWASIEKASMSEEPVVPSKTPRRAQEKQPEIKSRKTALLLCIFLGFFGAHKFYEGKAGMGILYLFTAGLFIFGWITDIFKLLKYPERF